MVAVRRSKRAPAKKVEEEEPAVKKAPAAKKTKAAPKKKKATAPASTEPAKKKAKRAPKAKATKKTPSPPGTPKGQKTNPRLPAVSPSPVMTAKSPVKPKKKTGGSHPVDIEIAVKGMNAADYTVLEHDGLWYDAVLNQCNITGGNNNNKYYRLQVLEKNGSFFSWQKWGRVGESARSSSTNWNGPFPSVEMAISVFTKKYRSKTGNPFGADTFVPKSGKYVLIEIDNDVDVEGAPTVNIAPAKKIEYLPSKLDPTTQDLVHTLFSKDMRNEVLAAFNLDLQKLPLGVPSQQQIAHGVSILEKIGRKIKGQHESGSYDQLSSDFYTAIPHSFGRSRPPSISDASSLQTRFDMCNILSDMYESNETVRKLKKKKEKVTTKIEKLPAQEDEHYDSLKTDLTLLDDKSVDHQAILKYFNATKRNPSAKVHNIWMVEREGEDKRCKKFDKLDNRKLLWHGTNIAVVAPILTSGLRIMPHSGGRVGSGIYLANMQEKSAQYTRGVGAKYACMFLTEAALGKEHLVTTDGPHASQLKTAPKGFDSVHAVGRVGPEEWDEIDVGGNKVSIPAGSAKPSKETSSTFHHDEHLCYDEAQVRLRYILTVKL